MSSHFGDHWDTSEGGGEAMVGISEMNCFMFANSVFCHADMIYDAYHEMDCGMT